MYTVQTLLRSKGKRVWTVSPDATVYQAIERMVQRGIGALVVHDGERMVGIVTERDYLRKVVLERRSSRETRVREIMTPRVLCVAPERTVDECMALMTSKRIRHLPVFDGAKMVGLVSIGDVVQAVIADKKIAIEAFERFVIGL